MRVQIVDDQRIFRESLQAMLATDPDIEIVGLAADGHEALELARRTHPEIVCMDIDMPRLGGVEATRRMLAEQPHIKVIGLSSMTDRRHVLDMLDAGAMGYISKNDAPEDLRHAIQVVSRDLIYLCPMAYRRIQVPGVPASAGNGDNSPLCLSRDSPELIALLAASEQTPTPAGEPELADEELYWLRQIVESSTVPSFVLNRGHQVVYWNKACETLTGVAADKMVGSRDHWRVFYTEQRPVLADLILDQAEEAEVRRHYKEQIRRSTLLPDAYDAEGYFPGIGEQGAWLYFTAAPLHDTQGRIIGAIETLQDFTERRRAENALKESEAHYRRLSITDNLTGLYNSRYFYEQIKTEIGRAIRYGHPLSLMLMDVDNFKRFNDTYGHPEGDIVLKQLAQVIANALRLGDSGYRIGGEEFAVLLPETDLEHARQAAERLRETFAATALSPGDEAQAVYSSVSIGVSDYRPYEKYSSLVRRTDLGCYQAKKSGKNRVFVV